MDSFINGFQAYFGNAKSYSPNTFSGFEAMWEMQNFDLIGYSNRNFQLYLGLKDNKLDSETNLFLFDFKGVEQYVVDNNNKKDVICFSENIFTSLDFEDFKKKHSEVFALEFLLTRETSNCLAEKIALALREYGEPYLIPKQDSELVYGNIQ